MEEKQNNNVQKLASVYNALATLLPIPGEEYSTKHAFCLQTLRAVLNVLEQAEKEE